MENLGETLVGDYLRYVLGCDFVDFNVYTNQEQGEIDVIGINNSEKTVYVCEVVTHLISGMRYSKNGRPDTGERLVKKFTKDIAYGLRAFSGYEKRYMLWSPVVKVSNGKDIYNQFHHLNYAIEEIESSTGVRIETIINEKYVDAIDALKEKAAAETKDLKSPIMRYLQIDHYSRKNANG